MNKPFGNNSSSETSDQLRVAGYLPLRDLAVRYGYAPDHIGWLARTGKVLAIRSGPKHDWYVRDISLAQYAQASKASGDYLPLVTLAEQFGYSKDYLGWLARAGKIDAIKSKTGQWFAREMSVRSYYADTQNKFVQPNLVSTTIVSELTQDKEPSKEQPLDIPTPEPVLYHEGSTSTQAPSKRSNTAFRFRYFLLLGGILVLMNLGPLLTNSIPSNLFNNPANIFDSIGNSLVDFVDHFFSLLPTSRTIVVINSITPTSAPSPTYITNPTTIINRQITITQNISPEQLDSLRKEFAGTSQLDLTKINETLNSLTTSVGILQSITGRIAQAPILPGTQNPNNTLSFGPTNFTGSVSVLGDLSDTGNFSTKTLNVSGVSTLSSDLSVGGNLTVNGSGTIGNQFSIVGSASLSGKLSLSKSPTIPHTGTWPSFSNPDEATLYINVLSPIADGNIIAYANNGSPKFLIDAEGDIYGNNLILTGSTTTATQTVGDLLVEGNSQFGDAIGDKIKFVGTIESKTLASVTFAIQASASQTADLFRVQDVNTNPLFKISNLGNASLSANFELTGTASIGGNTTLAGNLISSSTGSNSFAGSLDLSKGLRANYITATSGLLTNSISQYNAGPLTINAFTLGGLVTGNNQSISGINQFTAVNGFFTNTSVSNNFEITNIASIGGNILTKGTLVSSNTGSNSFAGSLDITKGLRASNFTQVGTAVNYFNGNVGIGTTAPRYKLDVGPVSSSQAINAGAAGLIRNSAGADSAPYTQARLIVYGGAGVDVDNWGYFAYGRDASMREVYAKTDTGKPLLWGTSSAMDGTGTFTPTMSLTNTGSLGVGTSNPQAKLDVTGSVATGMIGTENEFQLTRLINYAVSHPQIASFLLGSYTTNNSGNAYGPSTRLDINLKAAADDTLTADTNIMTLLSNGNVGIGTTAPGAQLQISSALAGTSGTDVFRMYDSGNVLRTNITAQGKQTWNLNSGAADVGRIQYSTPSGNPGIVFYTGATFDQNRFDIANSGTNFYLKYSADSSGAGININSGGNVGIGTTGPGYPLVVSKAGASWNSLGYFQDTTVAGYPFVQIGDGTNAISIGHINANPLAVSYGFISYSGLDPTAGQGIILKSNGNVGIGTTNPAAKLDIADTTLADSGSLAGSVLNLAQTWNTTGAPTAIKLVVTDTASNASSLALQILGGATGTTNLFKVDKTGIATFGAQVNASGFNGDMKTNNIIAANGNDTSILVGTGRTYSTVAPQLILASQTSSGGTGINQVATKIAPVYTQTSTAGATDLLINRTETSVGSGLQLLQDWQVGGVSKMVINNQGNVGIGTTVPGAKLDVVGNLQTNLQFISTNSSPMGAVNMSAAAGTTVVVDSSGDFRKLTSSERYKDNIIRDWNTADLAKFIALQPIQFDYKNGVDKGIVGFSAEESAGTGLPSLVNLDTQGLPVSLRDESFIAYQQLVLREHDQKIIDLGNKQASQSTEFETLQARVASLSMTVDQLLASTASASTPFSLLNNSSFIDQLFSLITAKFQSVFNIAFQNGIIQTLKGVFQNVEVQNGVTTYDRTTGQPYCIGVDNGQTVTTAGACSSSTPTPTPSPTPEVTPTPSPTPTASPTPDATPTPTETPTPTSEPTPTPSDTPTQ